MEAMLLLFTPCLYSFIIGIFFINEGQCSLPEPCIFPKTESNCTVKIEKYYYNATIEKCETYSTCDGREDEFKSLEECQKVCQMDLEVTLKESLTSSKKSVAAPQDLLLELIYYSTGSPCYLPKKVGPCKELHKRFYYNPMHQKCRGFYYGGCQGNLNNFRDVKSCISKCISPKSRHEQSDKSTICSLPKVIGNCSQFEYRYHYNQATKSCEEFFYSGCSGNENNFYTRNECQAVCQYRSRILLHSLTKDHQKNITNHREFLMNRYNDISQEPQVYDRCSHVMDTGYCYGSLKRFFYNSTTQKCQEFSYSGCGGNTNNFLDKIECAKHCKGNTSEVINQIIPQEDSIHRSNMENATLVERNHSFFKNIENHNEYLENLYHGISEELQEDGFDTQEGEISSKESTTENLLTTS